MDKSSGIHDRHSLPRLKLIVLCVGAAIGSLAASAIQADSGVGVDTQLGNALNPRTLSSSGERDPNGLGITEYPRTPTGFLHMPAQEVKPPKQTESGWVYSGSIEIGGIYADGDEDNAKFKEYKELDSGLYLNTFELHAEKPDGARFIETFGGGVGQDDQFYGLSIGRYNDWKVKAFFSEVPHVFTSTYRNIYNGVGSDNMTLIGLAPGGTTSAAQTNTDLRSAVTATPYSELSIVRSKGGVRLDMNLSEKWKFFAGYSQERKEGARPFGLVMGGGGGTGGIEIPESIDNTTHDLVAGLQWADTLSALNLLVQASFFRNDIDTMTVENPMYLNPATGVTGVAAGGFTTARFDMHPDSNYYNIKGEYARRLPDFYNGRFTALLSAGSIRQDDSLIPYTMYPGVAVNGVAGGSWETVASLSKTSADAQIDTLLADLGLSLNPVKNLDVKFKFRHYETDNSTEYFACNPLTGQWGRLVNEGSGAAIVNVPAYLAAGCDLAAVQALATAPNAGNVNIRNIPYEYSQTNFSVAGDYRLDTHNSVNGSLEREVFDREHRERDETWEDKLKLGYINRSLEKGSLRLSFETDRRRGSTYNPDPYHEFYSSYLGPLPTAAGTNVTSWVHVLAELRKFDLADRDQNILNAKFNYALAPNLDGGVSLQWKEAKYPDSSYGRNGHQRQNSVNLDLNWQQSERMNVYGFYSYQDSEINQANIQPSATNCVIPAGGFATQDEAEDFLEACAAAGGIRFPLNRAWAETQKDRNHVLGVGLNYDLGKARLDMNYTYAKGHSKIDYTYDAAGLGLTPAQVALIGSGFPALELVQHFVDAGLLVPINKTTAVRLLYRFEKGKFSDWHYDGVDVNPVPGTNQQTYLDAGPEDYTAHVFGILLRFEL